LIINDAEPAVSNSEILRLLKSWKDHGSHHVHEYHFEKDMHLPHDIITPGTPGVPVGEIQPRLIRVVQDLHSDR